MIIPVIRTTRTIKKSNNQQTAIEEQLSPSTTLMKASGVLSISRDDKVGQKNIPSNIPVPK